MTQSSATPSSSATRSPRQRKADEAAQAGTETPKKRPRKATVKAAEQGAPADPAAGAEASALRLIKKYPNRRLYDTQTSSYVTLQDVKQLVLKGEGFEVRDVKTGEDLTRSILLQIILEEETGDVPLFSSQMLAHLIRFYGHALQGSFGQLLERNLQMYADWQQAWVPSAQPHFNPLFPAMGMPSMGGPLSPLAPLTQLQEQMLKQAETLFPGLNRTGR